MCVCVCAWYKERYLCFHLSFPAEHIFLDFALLYLSYYFNVSKLLFPTTQRRLTGGGALVFSLSKQNKHLSPVAANSQV